MGYKFKYLIFRHIPYNRGETVAQINVSHLTKPQAKKKWKEYDNTFPPDKYHSSLTETNEQMREFIDLPDSSIETMNRHCPDCKKETVQVVKLYNPDEPEEGEVWECSVCKQNTGFAN